MSEPNETLRLMLRERELRAAFAEASERAEDADDKALELDDDESRARLDGAEAAKDAALRELAEVRAKLARMGVPFAHRVVLTKRVL